MKVYSMSLTEKILGRREGERGERGLEGGGVGGFGRKKKREGL